MAAWGLESPYLQNFTDKVGVTFLSSIPFYSWNLLVVILITCCGGWYSLPRCHGAKSQCYYLMSHICVNVANLWNLKFKRGTCNIFICKMENKVMQWRQLVVSVGIQHVLSNDYSHFCEICLKDSKTCVVNGQHSVIQSTSTIAKIP